MSGKKKILVIILISLLVIAVVLAIVFICQKEKEPTGEETVDWKTYRNENQGLELKFPSETKISIGIDEKGDQGAFFQAWFYLSKEKETFFNIQIARALSAASPPILPLPFCDKEQWTILVDQEILKKLYSVYDSKLGNELIECDSSVNEFLLNKHSIQVRFCLDDDSNFYPAKVGGALEPLYLCEKENSMLYYFELICEGEEWEGKDGQEECSKLFSQILSTFRFIKK